MPVRTYSPGDTAVIVDGNIITGFSDTDIVVTAREVDAFTKSVGADGEVTRTRSANKSGTITVTLKQSSPSNATLHGIADLDEQNGDQIFAMEVSDNLGYKENAAEAWIQKRPDMGRGNEEGTREWVFAFAKIKHTSPST